MVEIVHCSGAVVDLLDSHFGPTVHAGPSLRVAGGSSNYLVILDAISIATLCFEHPRR